MRRTTTAVALVATATLTGAILVFAPPPAALARHRHAVQGVTERTSKELNVGNAPAIVVDSDGGSLIVRAGAGGSVRVEAEKQAASADVLSRMAVSVEGGGDRVRVAYKRPEGVTGNAAVGFTLTVPADSRIEAQTRGGSILVENVGGALTLRTGGGSVAITGGQGTVSVETGGGSIKVQNRKADTLRLKTGGGGIDVSRVNGSVQAVTGGGSISLSGDLHGENVARTGGGSIRAAVPVGSSLAVEASTNAGRARNAWGLPVQKQGAAGTFRGSLGDGRGGTLKMTTGAGSVSLEKD
jgi:hypothetical protein